MRDEQGLASWAGLNAAATRLVDLWLGALIASWQPNLQCGSDRKAGVLCHIGAIPVDGTEGENSASKRLEVKKYEGSKLKSNRRIASGARPRDASQGRHSATR